MSQKKVQKSHKPVKKLEEVVIAYKVNFPKEAANATDPKTGKRAVMVRINSDKTYIPVEEDYELTFPIWSLLKNINFPYLEQATNDPLKDK